jgi:hypothetical protein
MENIKELWKRRIASWKESGMTARAWCKKQGFSQSTFSYWKGIYLEAELAMKEDSQFIELEDEQANKSTLTLSIQEISICLSEDFDSELLSRCLRVLKAL